MNESIIGILFILILLFVMFVIRMPVAFAMSIVGFIGFSYIRSFTAGLNVINSELWGNFSAYGFTVIPLFIFMGQIVFYSKVNESLYNTAYKCIGHIRGGIAMATVVACSAFSAICGSNTATAATMTTVALPEMRKYNYDSRLITGSIASGSTLGVVIPPSVVLIIIGLYTGQDIAQLFYGGVGPGILLTTLLIITAYVISVYKKNWGPAGPKTTFKEKLKSLPGSFEMVLLFFLVILGLYYGIFTPLEAGAAGSFLAIVIGVLQRKLTWKRFLNAVYDTLRTSAMVIMIIAGAMIFGKFLAATRIPFNLATWVVALPVSKIVIMLIIFCIYIIGGAIMDALALLLITIPIFFPVATQLGYDPLWFGITITVVTTLGSITPPVGATTFVVAGIANDIPLKNIYQGVSYFLPAYMLCILVMMLQPGIVTVFPKFIKYISELVSYLIELIAPYVSWLVQYFNSIF